MLFNLDADTGDAIAGWLVLDNPSEIPQYRFTVPGRADQIFEANVFRQDLFDLGMHSTGMAGFAIDEHMVPGLRDVNNFVLREASSNLPIYSRFDPEIHLERKLLMVDVGILPQLRTMQRMMDLFAISYPLVDRYSLETISWIFGRPYFRSTVVTGDVNWLRMASVIESSNFFSISLLRDPFEELAEKLIFLKRLIDQPANPVASPILAKYEALLPTIRDLDLSDPKSLLAAMRNLDRPQRRSLRSPMTYALGATPDEELQRRNVSIALDNLARFSVVGVRSRFKEFASSVDASLGAPIFNGMQLHKLPQTEELASSLSKIGAVCDLLDEDIALYSFVQEAVEEALSSQGRNESQAPNTPSRSETP